jgi:catechol 2,3-dioxygenase-like lactoylglutathione lyase family enzyme
MSEPKIASRLNHVAYLTADTGATYRFYTEVMGFKLVAAVRGDYDPESQQARPHLHTFFAMGSGEVIAFFDIEGLAPPKKDAHVPTWARHLAMSVESHDELLAWRQRLLDHGVAVTPVVDHFGVWYSIYFADPNDVVLELTYQTRALTEADAATAAQMVGEWTRAHGQRMAVH